MFAAGDLLVASDVQVLLPEQQIPLPYQEQLPLPYQEQIPLPYQAQKPLNTKTNFKREKDIAPVPSNKKPRLGESRDITDRKETIRENLEQVYARLSQRNAYGYTFLMRMVAEHNVQSIKEALSVLRQDKDKIVKLLRQQDADGRTALMVAIICGDTEIVRIFLKETNQEEIKYLLTGMYSQIYNQGSGVYRCNALSLTRAVCKLYGVQDMTNLFKEVLKVSKEEYEAKAKQVQPVFTPVLHPELVSKEILRQWARERLPIRDNVYGYTLLMHMVYQNNVKGIQKFFSMLSKDDKVDLLEQQSPDGRTALMIAIKKGYKEIVHTFLNAISTDQRAIKHLLTEMYMQEYKQGEGVYRYNALFLARTEGMINLIKSFLNVFKEEYESKAKQVQPVLTPVLHPELVSQEILRQWVLKRLAITDKKGHTLLMRMVAQNNVKEIQKSLSVLSKEDIINSFYTLVQTQMRPNAGVA